MTETLSIREPLMKGLRTSEDNSKADGFLMDAEGCMCTPYALLPSERIFQPSLVEVTHPYPQAMRLIQSTIVAHEDSISTLDGTVETPHILVTLGTASVYSGWTYVGLTATDGVNGVVFTGAGTATSSSAVVSGTSYQVRFTVSALTKGNNPGAVRLCLGGTYTDRVYREGTHTFLIEAGGTVVSLVSTASPGPFIATVTNVIITPFTASSIDSTNRGRWQSADFGNFWALFNGDCMIMHHPEAGSMVSSSVYANTGCAFRGRLYLGGLSNLLSATYLAAILTYRDLHKDSAPSYGDNFVWWSSVGLDEVLWPLLPSLMTKDKYLDVLERNEWGLLEMDWAGEPQAMIPLGNGVVVYGLDGITFLDHRGKTMARQEVAPFGILDRNSVDGDIAAHHFLDGEGVLWKLTAQLQLSRVGYEEFFRDLYRPSIVKHPTLNRIWIGDADDAYLLSEGGLTKIAHSVTSAVFVHGRLTGYYADVGDDEFSLMTSVYDLGGSFIKNIVGITLGLSVVDLLEATIFYRNSPGDIFRQTDWVAVKEDGTAPFLVSAVEFMIGVRSTTPLVGELNSISIHWNKGGRRSLTEYAL